MFVFTNANIGGTKRETGEFFLYIFDNVKTRVPVFDPRRRVTVGSKTQETLPAHPNGTRPHRTQDAAANRARLREETTTSTCPPKNGRAVPHPARGASFCLPRHALGSNLTAVRAGAAPAHHDARATHPKPTTGRGRRGNASSTPRQRRRGRADAKKRRSGARKNDPTSEACVTRRPFQASQRWRSGV